MHPLAYRYFTPASAPIFHMTFLSVSLCLLSFSYKNAWSIDAGPIWIQGDLIPKSLTLLYLQRHFWKIRSCSQKPRARAGHIWGEGHIQLTTGSFQLVFQIVISSIASQEFSIYQRSTRYNQNWNWICTGIRIPMWPHKSLPQAKEAAWLFSSFVMGSAAKSGPCDSFEITLEPTR